MGTSSVVVKDADVARGLKPVLAGGPDEAAARLLAEPDGVHCAELPDGARVWVVSQDDALTVRSIRVGRVRAGMVEVIEGLAPGERVVTRGSLFLDREAHPG